MHHHHHSCVPKDDVLVTDHHNNSPRGYFGVSSRSQPSMFDNDTIQSFHQDLCRSREPICHSSDSFPIQYNVSGRVSFPRCEKHDCASCSTYHQHSLPQESNFHPHDTQDYFYGDFQYSLRPPNSLSGSNCNYIVPPPCHCLSCSNHLRSTNPNLKSEHNYTSCYLRRKHPDSDKNYCGKYHYLYYYSVFILSVINYISHSPYLSPSQYR